MRRQTLNDGGRRIPFHISKRLREALAVGLELGKARLTAMAAATAAAGFALASGRSIHWPDLAWTVLGTGLTAAAANALNQWLEVLPDSRMARTQGRPLPSARAEPQRTFRWAAATLGAGVGVLALRLNAASAALALAAAAVYVLLYTPMKRRSSLCTLVGAIAGAAPPLIGWTAASGRLEEGAWLVGAGLFVWQIPHFLSLAWLHRNDYRRGGFVVLPVIDPSGQTTFRMIVLYGLALIPTSLSAALAGVAGAPYAAGSFLLGLGFGGLCLWLYFRRTEANARRLFRASVVYLALWLGLMVGDRTAATGGSRLYVRGADFAEVVHVPQGTSEISPEVYSRGAEITMAEHGNLRERGRFPVVSP